MKSMILAAIVAAVSCTPALALDKPVGDVILTVTGRVTKANVDGTAQFEAAMLERYQALIESWDIVIDGVGFLAVNVRN